MDNIDENLKNTNLETKRETVIREFGIPDERHNFRVSNECIPLAESQVQQAETLTSVMPGYIDGVGRLIQMCLINDRLRRSSKFYRMLRSILSLDARFQRILETEPKDEQEQNLEAEQLALTTTIARHHPFTRLDLIIDPNTNNLMIAEIEEAKLHGFGYSTLCRQLSETHLGLGLAEQIAEVSREQPVGMLLSTTERFYEVEARYFAKVVNSLGGNLIIIPESEMIITEEGIVKRVFGRNHIMVQTILTLPEFKQSKEEVSRLNRAVSKLYITGLLNVLSFQLPVLGEKATLALISNAQQDPVLEELLQKCFDPNVLSILRMHIPATILPFNNQDRQFAEQEILSGKQVFVKEISSSGARGIGKPGDTAKQLELVKSKKVIVQDAVPTKYFELPYTDLRTGQSGIDNFSVRVGVFGINGQLADVAMTASPSAVAHGGVTSIQTGVKVIQ